MPGACATSSGGLNPEVFTIFDAWEDAASPDRRSIARGEALFNTRTFAIDNVGGLNGGGNDPITGSFNGTCTICHDTPNAGNHSISMPLNIGLTDASRRTADLPLYTLRNKTTHDTVTTTDLGRAMVTGVERHRQVQRPDPPRARGPGPVFPQRFGRDARGRRRFLRHAVPHRADAPEKADLVAFLNAL